MRFLSNALFRCCCVLLLLLERLDLGLARRALASIVVLVVLFPIAFGIEDARPRGLVITPFYVQEGRHCRRSQRGERASARSCRLSVLHFRTRARFSLHLTRNHTQARGRAARHAGTREKGATSNENKKEAENNREREREGEGGRG